MVLLIIDKQTHDWKLITKEEKNLLTLEEQENVLYIDAKKREKLDFGLKQQKANNDVVGLITGTEGSGKSTEAGNDMRYITKDKFNPKEDIVGGDFEDAVKKLLDAKKGDKLMFDEGVMFFLSTDVLSRKQRDLHKIFSIIRQKRLFVLILIPSFFRLSSYFAIERSRFLIRTYMKGDKRGYFAYYGDKRKGRLYRMGKKEYNHNVVQPNFRGRFTKCNLLETPDYQKFKLSTLESAFTQAQTKKQPTEYEIKQKLIRDLIANNPDTTKELATMLKLTERRIYQIRNDLKK